MTLRHRAIARLQRHVPTVRVVQDRALTQRLDQRVTTDRPLPPSPGDGLKMPTERTVRNIRPITLGDPSPLLIRLVRHPYAQGIALPGRRPGTERPSLRPLAREGRAHIRELLDAARPQRQCTRPNRPVIASAPKPFKRSRASAIAETETLALEFG